MRPYGIAVGINPLATDSALGRDLWAWCEELVFGEIPDAETTRWKSLNRIHSLKTGYLVILCIHILELHAEQLVVRQNRTCVHPATEIR